MVKKEKSLQRQLIGERGYQGYHLCSALGERTHRRTEEAMDAEMEEKLGYS